MCKLRLTLFPYTVCGWENPKVSSEPLWDLWPTTGQEMLSSVCSVKEGESSLVTLTFKEENVTSCASCNCSTSIRPRSSSRVSHLANHGRKALKGINISQRNMWGCSSGVFFVTILQEREKMSLCFVGLFLASSMVACLSPTSLKLFVRLSGRIWVEEQVRSLRDLGNLSTLVKQQEEWSSLSCDWFDFVLKKKKRYV